MNAGTRAGTPYFDRSRGLFSGLLLVLAMALAFGANGTSWATRTMFDTDEFVSTSESTMRQPEVQTALSNRIADAIVTRGDVQNRIAERLPDGLELLSAPLTQTARDIIQRSALRLLQSDEFQGLVDRALRAAHGQVIAVLEDKASVLDVQGTSIVLDLQPLVERVQGELGERGQGDPLANVSLPPETGRIVLVDHAGGLRAASLLARYRQVLVGVIAGASILAIVAAVAVSRDRRVATRSAGAALVVAGALSVIGLVAARSVVISLAKDETAARAAFNEFTVDYRWQSVGLIVVGLLVAGLAVLAGDSHAARAVRALRGRPRDGERDDALTEVREGTRGLIIGAVVVTALVLLAWPQRGARVYATTVALLIVYCATLIMLASDAPWAASFRQRIGRLWSERPAAATDGTGARAWLAKEMRILQLGGVIIAAMALMFWPALTLGSFIIIVALMLLWVGSIEYSVGSA